MVPKFYNKVTKKLFEKEKITYFVYKSKRKVLKSGIDTWFD